jgi:transcriptional regulator of heat shock response
MSTKDLEEVVEKGDADKVIKVINQKLAIRNLTSANRQNLENQKKLLEETKARMVEYDPWLGAILESQQHAGK